MKTRATRSAAALGIGVLAGAVVLAGCSDSGPAGDDGDGPVETVTQSEIDEAMSTPTELTFWTWVPDIQNEIDLFEAAYPEINVTVENVGQGLPHYQRIRTALQAGEGAPDVVQVEYQYISSFTFGDDLLDLSPYGAADIADQYVPWVWNQVSNENGIFGIPQDFGPMGNLYRSDILADAGVSEPPATYDDYRAAAEKVREADSYISNFAPNNPGQTIGLFWQAGAKPFGYSGGEEVNINVNSLEIKEVMDYWQDMIDDDLVSVDADFTDSWYQGLAQGKYAGWLGAAWGPVFLQGTVSETSGKWAVAPLPQWDASNPASGNWGGSGDSVLASTENPIAASQLAIWLNNDLSSTRMLAIEQFFFSPQLEVLNDPEIVGQEFEFYGGQPVNEVFSEISETVDTEFEWLPFMDFAYSSWDETIGAEIAAKGDLAAGLDAWQAALVDYGTQQGFTVTEG